jgi:hypothetical protein
MAPTATAEKMVITMGELRESREFKALTDKQKIWLTTYLETSDMKLATSKSYGDKTAPEYRSMLAAKILSSPRIKAALDLVYARSPRERFLRDLESDCRRLKGTARVEAQKLFARISGFDPQPAGADDVETETCPDPRVPADALEVWCDRVTGVVIGFRSADGTAVKLS